MDQSKMNQSIRVIALLAYVCVLSETRAAESTSIDVWPGKPAGDDAATIGAEGWIVAPAGDKRLTNVTRPTLGGLQSQMQSRLAK